MPKRKNFSWLFRSRRSTKNLFNQWRTNWMMSNQNSLPPCLTTQKICRCKWRTTRYLYMLILLLIYHSNIFLLHRESNLQRRSHQTQSHPLFKFYFYICPGFFFLDLNPLLRYSERKAKFFCMFFVWRFITLRFKCTSFFVIQLIT